MKDIYVVYEWDKCDRLVNIMAAFETLKDAENFIEKNESTLKVYCSFIIAETILNEKTNGKKNQR